MTREELLSLIRNTAGETVSKALERVHERRADLGVTQIVQTAPAEAKNAPPLLGWIACALASSKGDRAKAIELVEKTFPAHIKEAISKALVTGELTEGGAFFSPEHSQQIVDLLTPRTVVRRHVAATVDVSAGAVEMARITADASVSWGGEISEIRESQPTTDQLTLRPFQEKVMVPFSNTFLRRGGPTVAALVQRSTLRSMAIGEDVAFITSPGSENRPKGLQYWAPAVNRIPAQAFTGTDPEKLAKVTQDLGKLLLALEQANVPMTAAFWAFSPRSKNYLFTARTSLGVFAFNDEMKNGVLWGIPFEVTTSIPNNQGSGADESRVYLTDGDEFMLGQGAAIQVDISDQGTIIDADGNVISLYQRNMSALRVILEVDLKPQHAEATAHLTGVKWAAGSV